MSLEDRFNTNDGSLIDRFDSAMVSLQKKIGDRWQDYTGLSARKLERIYYGFAALGHAYAGALVSKPILFLGCHDAYCAAYGNPDRRTCDLKESAEVEMLGWNSKLPKYYHAAKLVSGSILLATDAAICLSSYDNNWNDFVKFLGWTGFSSAMILESLAGYLEKANFEPPKKKKKKVPLWKLAWNGRLVPEPVP